MKPPQHIPHLLACFAMACIGITGFAQKKKVENLPGFDKKKIHFGFTLGINSSDFVIDADFDKGSTPDRQLVVVETERQPGFNLGIVSDLHLGPFFDLRFIPQLSFAGRLIEFTYLDSAGNFLFPPIEQKQVESTYLDFPLDLKYRSARLNNFAAYVVGGAKYSLDLASQADVDNGSANFAEQVVKLKKHGFSWQFGFGMDFFLQYFKFSPEIKMSLGLDNVHVQDGTRFNLPFNSIRSKIFLISFTFEG